MSIINYVNTHYMGTDIKAEQHTGMGNNVVYCLDCNNGGDDCSTGDYEY